MGNTCSRFLSGSSPTPPPPAPSDGGSNKSHGGGGSVKPTGDSSHGGSVKPPAGGSSHGGSSHRPPPSDSVHKPSPHESPLPQVMTVDSPKSETTRNDSLPKGSSPQDHSPDNTNTYTNTDTNADDSSDSDDGDHDPHINNSFNKTEDDNYASNANDTIDRSSSDSSDAPDVDGANSTYLPTFTNENNDSSSDDDDAQYLPSLTNNAAKSDDPLRNNSNASSATYTTNYAEPIHQSDSNLYDDLYQDADAFDFDSTTDDFDSNTDTSPPKSQIEALSLIKPLPTNKNIKTKDDDKPKKPVRTRSSIDFVLGRKTPNVKEFYNMGQKLGEGQFGTTFLCTDKASGREYACKSIAKRKLRSPEDVEDVRREIQIMHHLEGNPHVVQIVAAFEDAVAVHVVMELCEGGELFDRIIERGHYTERKAAELARTIVEVVEGCHSLGVMHRDLKPENFLFVDEDEDSLLKTIDFGLSIFFRPGETFGELVGSPYYVAPEVLNKCYGPEIDVWSAGVVLYILLCGVPPFWDETESGIFDQVLKAELDFVSEPWPDISDGAKDLIGKMLERDPKKRLTAHEVLCHPWIREDGDAPDKPLDSAVLTRLKQFSSMNKLKRIVIRVIAETLSEEQIAGLKQMFKTIDADDSGHITLEELKIGLEQAGANLQDSEIIKLMKAADADNSGTIDYSEFVAAMLHLNKVQREDHLFAAFTYFDKDGSGYITKDEIQQACQQFGLADVHLEELIREADQDNDGSIDYSEFVDMMHATEFGKKHY